VLVNQKKILGIIVIALFALSFLYSAGLASAKSTTINVYDGDSIQAAVNIANSGDKILVHAGTYYETVSISKPLTIIGVDATIEARSGEDGFAIFSAVTVTGFKIQPKTYLAEGEINSRAGIMIWGPDADGVTIINNDILPGFFYPGIWVHDPVGTGSSGIKILNNKITSVNTGISLEEGSDISVTGNVIEAGGFGIWSSLPDGKITNLEIANNIIHCGTVAGSDADGIFLNPGWQIPGYVPSSVTIRNNKVNSESTGLYKEGIQISRIMSCSVIGNEISTADGGNGIFAEYSRMVIKGNKISAGSGANGIWISQGINCQILGNEIIGSYRGTGITISSGVGHQIIGNKISPGFEANGINAGGASEVVIVNNVIQSSHSVGRGMDIGDCKNVIVRDNKVSTGQIGIHFSPGVIGGIVTKNEVIVDNGNPSVNLGIVFNTVSDCVASDNVVIGGDRSIWAMWSDKVMIKNNEFSPNSFNSGGIGVYLAHVANSFVTGNKVVGNVLEGISLDQGSNANYILRNTIIIPGANGIWLSWETFGNYVINNRISSAGTPIQDDSGLNIIIP
jgi:hypothetical protein